jgi:hypothetical protein
MTNDFQIKIPKPCRAGWESMEEAEKGKFCGECSRIVIDFTSMTTDEIKDYFLNHHDQRICGHFISSQLKRHNSFQQSLLKLHCESGKIRYRVPRVAASMLLAGLMILSGCGPSTDEIPEHITGDSIYVTPEMLKQDSIEQAKLNDSLNKLNNPNAQ